VVLWEYSIVALAVSFLAILLAIRVASIRHEARAKVAAVNICGGAVRLLMSTLQLMSVIIMSSNEISRNLTIY